MTRHRRASLVLAAIAIAIAVAGCSGSAASQTLPPASSNLSPGAVRPAEPGRAVDVDTLVAAAAANDGQPVRVRGFLVIDGTSARICAASLESYPPQCGGPSARITGEVPRATLQLLSRTSDPTLAQETWGSVVVTGTFRAVGAGGGPTIELGEIIIEEG